MYKSSKKMILYFLAVFGLLIFLHFLGILQPVEGLASRGINPILKNVYRFSSYVRNTYNEQNDRRDLSKINKQQQDQITLLTVENAKLRILDEENQSLRRYLQFLAKKEYHYSLGNVISRGDITGSGQSVIIDKGIKDGIAPGFLVVDSFGAVVGKVSEVKEAISEVYLTTNPKNKMAAAIQNDSKTSGIIQGEMGLVINMSFIPQTENIKVGDVLVTSGLEQNVPRGFAIGRVMKVTKENNELWQNASIEPLVDLDKLVDVAVLLPSVK